MYAGSSGDQKRALDLDLKLQVVWDPSDMCAGNQLQSSGRAGSVPNH